MTESRSGPLDRLGPLGFLTLFVVLALALAFYKGGQPTEKQDVPTLQPQSLVSSQHTDSASLPSPTATESTLENNTTGESTHDTRAESEPRDDDVVPGTVTAAEPETGSSTPEASAEGNNGSSMPVQAIADTQSENTLENIQTTNGADAATVVKTDIRTDDISSGVVDAGDNASMTKTTEPSQVVDDIDQDPRFRVSEAAQQLVQMTRERFSDQKIIDPLTGRVSDSVKTGLIEVVDAMKQNSALVSGFAASLNEKLGMLSFPSAEKHATVVKQFFIDNGVEAGRMVAGVLAPDYVQEDGRQRQVSFFFAEKNP